MDLIELAYIDWWDINWGTAGTWFGAVATLLGAIGTVTAVFVSLGIAKQARDTADLARQDAIDVRREVNAEKRIEQASRVCAWREPFSGLVGEFQGFKITNASAQPVHSVIAYAVFIGDTDGPRTGEEIERSAVANNHNVPTSVRAIVPTLPPGTFRVPLPEQSSSQGPLDGSIELAFTDSAGRHWVRRAQDGALTELTTAPREHYGIRNPISYSKPEPA